MKSVLCIKTSRHDAKRPLTIVVGKRALKKAVERNKFKRRIRVIMRPVLKSAKKQYTIYAHPGAGNLSFEELKQQIEQKTLTGN